MIIIEFTFGKKVFFDGEYGVVTNDFVQWGAEQNNFSKKFGLIRWDTENVSDLEDWRGLEGSFKNSGGIEVSPNHVFTYINDDGSLKSQDKI